MASGILSDAVNAVVDVLTDLGFKAVTDPRNVRPNSVFVQLPTATGFTYNVGDIRITAIVCAAPPGNGDAANYLLTAADQIMNSSLAVIDLRPGMVSVGGQDLPSYDLTIAVSVRRN